MIERAGPSHESRSRSRNSLTRSSTATPCPIQEDLRLALAPAKYSVNMNGSWLAAEQYPPLANPHPAPRRIKATQAVQISTADSREALDRTLDSNIVTNSCHAASAMHPGGQG